MNALITSLSPAGRRARQRGLSLVELMVALLLGSFVTLGIIQMFTANRETYQVNVGQARLQENARFALMFLSRPIRMVGFKGCFSEDTDVFNALNPGVSAEVDYMYDLDNELAGFEATSATNWSPNPTALPDDIEALNPTGGSDILVVRAAESSGMRIADTMPNSSSNIFTIVPDDPADPRYAEGAILLLSDCEKGAIFQVSGSGVAGGKFRVTHNPGGSISPGNSTQRLDPDDKGFGTDASVYTMATDVYFVAPSATGVNNAGETPNALWRKRGNTPPVELVEGIENVQFLYGVDSDTDSVPNRYVTIQNVLDPTRVMTIRVSLTASSVDRVTDDNNTLTRTFTKTIALRNRIGG